MFGIYIHWPFCLSKCIYCDFGSRIINSNVDQNAYFFYCKKQLQYFHEKIADKNITVTSIYFGGGTPSILDPKIVAKLINEIRHIYVVSNDCEITLEANPTSSGIEKFKMLCDAGINRLSLGIQSFDDNELAFLGRRHSVKDALKAINCAKQIFPKWSIDLIYGLPRQKPNKWLEELQIATDLGLQHISLYTLIVDENTPLGRLVKNGNIKPKTEDELSCFYDVTNEFLARNTQLKQYEVSNYAIKGYESRHNLTYWKSYDYIGIGAGAHGRLFYNDCSYNNNRVAIGDNGNDDYYNNNDCKKSDICCIGDSGRKIREKSKNKRYEIKNIFDHFEWQKCCNGNANNYSVNDDADVKADVNNGNEINGKERKEGIKKIGRNVINGNKDFLYNKKKYDNSDYGIEIEKRLTKRQQAEEILIMGLRIKDGIDINDIKMRFNINLLRFLDIKNIEKLKAQKVLNFDGKTLSLTKKGLKILDAVLLEIFK